MVASALREAAGLLKAQAASQFRVLAYLKAATTIEELQEDISTIAARGIAALDAVPNIGAGIGAAIRELVSTGKWSQLDRLRGGLEPEVAFRSVPGVGPKLAQIIHEHLHVDTLEALEAAAHDGRLAAVPGIGPRRLSIIRDGLNGILSRRGTGSIVRPLQAVSPVDLLLDVDREYRTRAEARELRHISPKRFNPRGEAWLPILHTERGPWHFTVLSVGWQLVSNRRSWPLTNI